MMNDEQLIELYEEKLALQKSNHTAEMREKSIKRFAEWFDEPLTEINQLSAYRYIRNELYENRGLAGKSIQSEWEALVDFSEWLDDDGFIDGDPLKNESFSDFSAIPAKTKKSQYADNDEGIVFITKGEKEALVEHVSPPHFRNRLIIELLWQTGMRQSEVRNLKLDEVKMGDGILDLQETKGGGNRVVPFQTSLKITFNEWFEEYRPSYKPAASSEYVFVTNRSERLGESRVNTIVKKAADNAGIQETMYVDAAGKERKKVTAHTLRHSFARNAILEGLDVTEVRDLMGHTSIDVTNTYLDLTEDDITTAYREHLG